MAQLLTGNRAIPLGEVPITEFVSNKAEQIMEGMLLEQYQNSPNLKEYMMCFLGEFDLIFEEIQKVYLGRMLQHAVGNQLDVIGIHLKQQRAVALPTVFFGFLGAISADGMASEVDPTAGGIFKDENQGTDSLVPLSDVLYRRVLFVLATLTNQDTVDISLVYFLVTSLINRVPSLLELTDIDSYRPELASVLSTSTVVGWDALEDTLTQNFDCIDGETYYVSTDYIGSGTGVFCKLSVADSLAPTTELASSVSATSVAPNEASNIPLTWVATFTGTAILTFSEDRTGLVEALGTYTTEFNNMTIVRENKVTQARAVELLISRKGVSAQELSLILYMSKYFIPAGTTFTIRQV